MGVLLGGNDWINESHSTQLSDCDGCHLCMMKTYQLQATLMTSQRSIGDVRWWEMEDFGETSMQNKSHWDKARGRVETGQIR